MPRNRIKVKICHKEASKKSCQSLKGGFSPLMSFPPAQVETFCRQRRDILTPALTRENLGVELVKAVRHFFPDLMARLRDIADPRHQSYVKYKSHVLLASRILSAIFYISSMRKTSEEFNSPIVIENIGCLCGEELEEL